MAHAMVKKLEHVLVPRLIHDPMDAIGAVLCLAARFCERVADALAEASG
jgi:hypothetical protein